MLEGRRAQFSPSSPKLLQELDPQSHLLLRAQVCTASEAMKGCAPSPGGNPPVNDGCWQVTEQVAHDVHIILISNRLILKSKGQLTERCNQLSSRHPNNASNLEPHQGSRT